MYKLKNYFRQNNEFIGKYKTGNIQLTRIFSSVSWAGFFGVVIV